MGRDDGEIEYTFANGNRFVGSVVNGAFHGKGTLFLAGGGAFVGEWADGKALSGAYTFDDGLAYAETAWDYCSEADRRFHCERVTHIPPAGMTLFANQPLPADGGENA